MPTLCWHPQTLFPNIRFLLNPEARPTIGSSLTAWFVDEICWLNPQNYNFVYRFFIGFYHQYNYSIENWVWLGLELRLLQLQHQHATSPTLVMGALPPRFTFPSQGCLNAATELLLPVGRSSNFSSHPTVLASKVAWITGESQFSRLYYNYNWQNGKRYKGKQNMALRVCRKYI